MNPAPPIAFGVAILAAGASSRMGRPKLLLPWQDTTIIGHLVREWRTLGADPVAVVVAPGNSVLEAELTRLDLPPHCRILNAQPELGMFSSIRCAAAWTGWRAVMSHVVFTLGDQPHVAGETLRGLLEFAATRSEFICQPDRSGHGRHPVVVPRRFVGELAVAGEGTLKAFLARRQASVSRWSCDDAGLDLDIDEPADYERAQEWVRRS